MIGLRGCNNRNTRIVVHPVTLARDGLQKTAFVVRTDVESLTIHVGTARLAAHVEVAVVNRRERLANELVVATERARWGHGAERRRRDVRAVPGWGAKLPLEVALGPCGVIVLHKRVSDTSCSGRALVAALPQGHARHDLEIKVLVVGRVRLGCALRQLQQTLHVVWCRRRAVRRSRSRGCWGRSRRTPCSRSWGCNRRCRRSRGRTTWSCWVWGSGVRGCGGRRCRSWRGRSGCCGSGCCGGRSSGSRRCRSRRRWSWRCWSRGRWSWSRWSRGRWSRGRWSRGRWSRRRWSRRCWSRGRRSRRCWRRGRRSWRRRSGRRRSWRRRSGRRRSWRRRSGRRRSWRRRSGRRRSWRRRSWRRRCWGCGRRSSRSRGGWGWRYRCERCRSRGGWSWGSWYRRCRSRRSVGTRCRARRRHRGDGGNE